MEVLLTVKHHSQGDFRWSGWGIEQVHVIPPTGQLPEGRGWSGLGHWHSQCQGQCLVQGRHPSLFTPRGGQIPEALRHVFRLFFLASGRDMSARQTLYRGFPIVSACSFNLVGTRPGLNFPESVGRLENVLPCCGLNDNREVLLVAAQALGRGRVLRIPLGFGVSGQL